MAGANGSSFNETRSQYLDSISLNLTEARSLMVQLNSNLKVWAERTGELDSLAEVWSTFQNRLACLSSAFQNMDDEKPLSDSPIGAGTAD